MTLCAAAWWVPLTTLVLGVLAGILYALHHGALLRSVFLKRRPGEPFLCDDCGTFSSGATCRRCG